MPVEHQKLLYMAKGSAGEVRAQLYLALDLSFISKEEFQKLNQCIISVSKQLASFINYLQRSPLPKRTRPNNL